MLMYLMTGGKEKVRNEKSPVCFFFIARMTKTGSDE